MSNNSDLKIVARLLQYARPYWGHLVVIFLLKLLAAPLAILNPVPLKIAVDSVLGSDPLFPFFEAVLPDFATDSKLALLLLATILLVLVVLLHQLQSLGSYVLSTYTGEPLTLGFRERLFRHVQRLSFAYHDSKGTGDSIYRIQYDTPSIQNITINGLIPFVSALVTLVLMIYVTVLIDWHLALVALAVTPFLFLLSRGYKVRMRARYREAKQLESEALKVVQEVLGAVRVVKAFGREDAEQERFVRYSSRKIRARIKLSFAEGAFGLLVNVVTALGTASVLFIGIRNVQSGMLTLGELIMVLTYLGQLYSPLKTVSSKVATLQNSLASAQRAFELLDEVPDVIERANARPLKRAAGSIEFQNVFFSFDDKKPVLRDISFKIPAGTKLGIAGRTGAGKTSLVSLLMRFYDPHQGQIFLDKTDLRDYKLADLREQFALVFQEPLLFSTTIAENIAYGRPQATEEEIIRAAQSAGAHEFIVKLPEGYKTLVGERGMQLSGGERQRVSLARAFLKDAPILILDEPTSSVDLQTEASILQTMARLMQGRTTFMITHRLSTLETCDVLLVIEDGRLFTLTSEVSTAIEHALAVGSFDASIRGAKANA